MTSANNNTPLRIVVGCDNAGHTYKEALKDTLQKHKGVSEVLDVGVKDPKDGTSYPYSAVEAARKIKNGEVSAFPMHFSICEQDITDGSYRPIVLCLSAVLDSESQSPPTKWKAFEQ